MSKNTRQVSSRVATVIPEIGLEDEPISPVRRDETVTNRKPKATISTAPRKATKTLTCNPSCGNAIIIPISAMIPAITNVIGRS